MGRSGVSRPYLRRRASRHSSATSSVLFPLGGYTVSQDPVFVACYIQCAPCTGAPTMVAARASSARWTLIFQTTVLPSQRQAEWSAVQNSTWPLRAATSCPMTTQDAIQFSGDVSFGSGRSNPACFTGRQVTPLTGAPSPNPSNRAGKKDSCSAFSDVPKAYPIPGMNPCKNAHACLSDFCIPV